MQEVFNENALKEQGQTVQKWRKGKKFKEVLIMCLALH